MHDENCIAQDEHFEKTTGSTRFASPDGKYSFEYGEGSITVTEVDALQ